MHQFTEEYIFDESLGRQPYSFSIGVKELLFLTVIFSFGFFGFSLCFENVYFSQKDDKIDNLMLHDAEVSSIESIYYLEQIPEESSRS